MAEHSEDPKPDDAPGDQLSLAQQLHHSLSLILQPPAGQHVIPGMSKQNPSNAHLVGHSTGELEYPLEQGSAPRSARANPEPAHTDAQYIIRPFVHAPRTQQELRHYLGSQIHVPWSSPSDTDKRTAFREQNLVVHRHRATKCPIGVVCEPREFTTALGVEILWVPSWRLKDPDNPMPLRHCQSIDYELALLPEGARLLEIGKVNYRKSRDEALARRLEQFNETSRSQAFMHVALHNRGEDQDLQVTSDRSSLRQIGVDMQPIRSGSFAALDPQTRPQNAGEGVQSLLPPIYGTSQMSATSVRTQAAAVEEEESESFVVIDGEMDDGLHPSPQSLASEWSSISRGEASTLDGRWQ